MGSSPFHQWESPEGGMEFPVGLTRAEEDMKRSRCAFRLAVLLALLVAGLAPRAGAQTAGAISGTIVDQTAAVLPGATVTATDEATGRVRTTGTSAQGFFR